MLNVRLAGGHLYGKLLFTWLSLVMSMMVSMMVFFFPRGVLVEILNLIESVSEGFPSYFLKRVIRVQKIGHSFYVIGMKRRQNICLYKI